jgi:hypothetical protein
MWACRPGFEDFKPPVGQVSGRICAGLTASRMNKCISEISQIKALVSAILSMAHSLGERFDFTLLGHGPGDILFQLRLAPDHSIEPVVV